VRICDSFAEKIWGAKKNVQSTAFDQCGIKGSPFFITADGVNKYYKMSEVGNR
jgi:hypothetical protein